MKKVMLSIAVVAVCSAFEIKTWSFFTEGKQAAAEQGVLSDNSFNKVSVLHTLSSLNWFIEKNAKVDAAEAKDQASLELFKKLQNDLKPYVRELHNLLCKESAQKEVGK